MSSKFLAEQVARDAARVGGSLVIVNPSTPVGPGDVKPSEKAVRELGYRWRAPAKAFEDVVLWLREQELL